MNKWNTLKQKVTFTDILNSSQRSGFLLDGETIFKKKNVYMSVLVHPICLCKRKISCYHGYG